MDMAGRWLRNGALATGFGSAPANGALRPSGLDSVEGTRHDIRRSSFRLVSNPVTNPGPITRTNCSFSSAIL